MSANQICSKCCNYSHTIWTANFVTLKLITLLRRFHGMLTHYENCAFNCSRFTCRIRDQKYPRFTQIIPLKCNFHFSFSPLCSPNERQFSRSIFRSRYFDNITCNFRWRNSTSQGRTYKFNPKGHRKRIFPADVLCIENPIHFISTIRTTDHQRVG